MIHHLSVYYIPILISTLVCFSLGAFWFSPALFGRKWRELTGKPVDENIPFKSYLFFLSIILVFNIAMSVLADMTGTFRMSSGVIMGLSVWIGFGLPVISFEFLFERRNALLLFITSGYFFVASVISGALHSLWR